MPFNRKKFLEAILAMSADQAPIAPLAPPKSMTNDFAKFMAAHSYGVTDPTDAAVLSSANSSNRDEGALSKTFGWLLGPMNTVENIVMDVTDSQGPKELLGNLGKDIGAGFAHLQQPLLEIAAVPGVHVPWEPDSISKFIEKENTQYHGTGPISGTRLIDERGHKNQNPVVRAIAGLGLDIALDPLTYLGGAGLFTKGKSAKKAIEEVAALSKPGGSTKAFVKPDLPKATGKSKFTLPGRAPLETVAPINTSVPPIQPQFPLQHTFMQKNLELPLDPESLKKVSAVRAGEFKLYEKLRPVVIPETVIPARSEFAHLEATGNELVKTLGLGAPRGLTRAEQAEIFNKALSEVSTKTVAEQKYLMKGVEDSLEEVGFAFPEGKLSQYLHNTKKSANLEEFAKGKPLKEAAMDASVEQKLLEANQLQGRKLLEGKLSKKYPGKVTTPFGINSKVVSEAIDKIASRPDDFVFNIPRAEGTGAVREAVSVAESYRKALGRAHLNPKDQAGLYEQIFKAAGRITDPEKQRALSLSMMKTAEEHLAAKHGLRGHYWDDSTLSLTKVIEEFGPDVTDETVARVVKAFKTPTSVKDSVAEVAIAQAMARRSMDTGTIAKVILDDFVDKSKALESTISRQKYLEWKKSNAVQRAKFASKAAGLSPKETAAVLDLLKNHVDTEGLELLEPFQVMDAIGPKIIKAVLAGHADAKLIKKMNNALRDAVGESAKEMSLDFKARSAIDTFLMRWTTWYNRGEMFQSSAEATSYFEQWAKARADWLNHQVKNFTPEEIMTAFKHSQGTWKGIEAARVEQGIDMPLVTDRIAKLSAQFSDLFENIVASSRTINDSDKLVGSIAVREAATMSDVNRQLKNVGSKFQFVGGKVKTSVSGNPADYTEGNWLTSWENVDPTKFGQDPVHFMYDLSLAMDRVTAEYSLIDDFVMRFGKEAGDVGFDPLVNTHGVFHHRIAPTYKFDKKVASDFKNLLDDLEKGNWMASTPFTRKAIKYQRIWKTGVTQYNPSFHERNALGDTFLMWLAGHNNPIHFKYAAKMVAANRQRYRDAVKDPNLDALTGFMSREEYGILQSKDTDVLLKKYGADITSAELYGEALQRGQLLSAYRDSDIIGDPLFAHTAGKNPDALKRFAEKPLGGKAHDLVVGVTEIREHTIRLAHFSSAVNKGITKQIGKRLKAINDDPTIVNKVAARRKVLEPVYEKASREVRKWHPDGRDLSYFEQKYMRNIIPFYSWQRKVIPLLLETMYTRPAKLTAYPKGMFALQQALGIDAPSISDPFPTDQLFPDWMRAGGIGPIGDPQSDNAAAAWWGKLGTNALLPGISGEYGYTVVNPGNPFNDEISTIGIGKDPIQSAQAASSLLTPYFNIPKELLSGTTWTGGPISTEAGGAGYPNWLSSQIPIASMFNRVARIGAKEQPSYVEDKQPDKEAIINILTALGLRGTGQYLKSAQFDARK